MRHSQNDRLGRRGCANPEIPDYNATFQLPNLWCWSMDPLSYRHIKKLDQFHMRRLRSQTQFLTRKCWSDADYMESKPWFTEFRFVGLDMCIVCQIVGFLKQSSMGSRRGTLLGSQSDTKSLTWNQNDLTQLNRLPTSSRLLTRQKLQEATGRALILRLHWF